MKLRLGLVFLAAALVFSAVVAVSSPAAAQQAVALEDVSVRDNLIAQQESLLNTYRCRFDIDTQIVPGGCTDGEPSQDPAEPDPFEGIPTQGELAVRNNLIAQQESLLNTYRCRFDIDTQIVPGGCTDGEPSQDPAEPDPFEGIPTQGELAVRNNLIAQQESLLNTYRCRFDIDTQIVPGGCTDSPWVSRRLQGLEQVWDP
ncbi:MAG: hypothetical protein OXI18_04865, partial [bacterium]|nr:hypothetical protein [bacterium]